MDMSSVHFFGGRAERSEARPLERVVSPRFLSTANKLSSGI